MNSLIRRLIISLFLLTIVSMASFSLLQVLPGDFAEVLLMQQMDGVMPTAEALDRFKQENGLYDPLPVQYLHWLSEVLGGNLGTSFQSGDTVVNELRLRIPNTLMLAFFSTLVSLLIAFPAGVLATLWPGSIFDHVVMTASVIGMAIPGFWLALLGILLFSVMLGWLPVSGYTSWLHLILPSVIIGISMAGVTVRFVRSSMLELVSADFVRTAYAKGLSPRRVILRHVLPNAMVPIVTLVGLQLAKMFDNVVIIEAVFAWPGIGRLFIESILGRDFPVIQGCVLVVGFAYIIINLTVDLIISILDPRIEGAL